MGTRKIKKTLSQNDVGETGGHQAGMLIPKKSDILDFFPALDSDAKNPRTKLLFSDDSGGKWEFAFIHYNNKLFGGTRDEYRLTGMTKYFKSNALKAGDSIILSKDSAYDYAITHLRDEADDPKESGSNDGEGKKRLVVSMQWIVVDF